MTPRDRAGCRCCRRSSAKAGPGRVGSGQVGPGRVGYPRSGGRPAAISSYPWRLVPDGDAAPGCRRFGVLVVVPVRVMPGVTGMVSPFATLFVPEAVHGGAG